MEGGLPGGDIYGVHGAERSGPYGGIGKYIPEKGFLEYKEDIGRELERLDYLNDPEALDKEAELKGMSIACDAIILLASRYAQLAEKLAEECGA